MAPKPKLNIRKSLKSNAAQAQQEVKASRLGLNFGRKIRHRRPIVRHRAEDVPQLSQKGLQVIEGVEDHPVCSEAGITKTMFAKRLKHRNLHAVLPPPRLPPQAVELLIQVQGLGRKSNVKLYSEGSCASQMPWIKSVHQCCSLMWLHNGFLFDRGFLAHRQQGP